MMLRFMPVLLLVAIAPEVVSAEQHEVRQEDRSFSQERLTVEVGDTIVFVNDDVFTHNVFSRSTGNKFEIKAQPPGNRSDVLMKRKGTVDVRCALHPGMRLEVEVRTPASAGRTSDLKSE